MPKYTLYYFDARGRAELIRLIFALAGVEYEDFRFPHGEWKEAKKDTKKFPFGQLPVLQVDDDVFIPQGYAIARYLANEFGLAGKTVMERTRCDVLLYACHDIYQTYYIKMMELSDAAEKAKFQKEFIQTSLQDSLRKIECYLVSKGHGQDFVVSKEPTFADVLFISLSDTFTEEAFNDFPVLKSVLAKIKAVPNIKAWLEKRPKTAM